MIMTKAEIQQRYTERHPDRIKESQKKYNLSEKSIQRRKKYYGIHHESILERRKRCYEKNREKELQYHKTHYKIVKDERCNYSRKYYEKNKNNRLEYVKEYYKKNRDKRLEYGRKYRKEHQDMVCKAQKIYRCSDKGHQRNKRGHAKAKNKRWIRILPNIFPKDIPIDDHHIDGKLFVVPLPKKIHQKSTGRNLRQHIEDANGWIEFFYGMNPLDFIIDAHSAGQDQPDTLSVSPVALPSPRLGH